ncbi:MAG: hypothetical protein MUC68_10635, partial [Burkholderiaceae bacterium]|nr:hypothetical protein [Burkholderiaceae bacterium]
DDDIHQLVFALAAMANDYCMSREFMKMLAPGVLDRPQASERILDRLVSYARALLDAEIARRRPAVRPSAARPSAARLSAAGSPAARGASTRRTPTPNIRHAPTPKTTRRAR